MFDIIRCKAEPSKYGFEKFYLLEDLGGKIINLENAKAAAALKGRKVLIILRDYTIDEGSIKLIGEKKNVCFLIDIGKVIRSSGVSRAITISKIRSFLKLCLKHGTYYTFSTFAEGENEIRTPDELEHIAMLFDLNRGQARFSLRMLKSYL